MTHEEILKKAINKAIKNGWNTKGNLILNYWINKILTEYNVLLSTASYQIIFRQDFAKAFFGEGMQIDYTKPCPHCKGKLEIANPTGSCYHVHYPEGCDICSAYYIDWEDCLQEMVLEKDPISYLERFI